MNKILEQSLADQRDAAEKRVLELEDRVRDLERQIFDWVRDHAKLNDDLDNLTTVYDRQRERIRILESENAELRSDIDMHYQASMNA